MVFQKKSNSRYGWFLNVVAICIPYSNILKLGGDYLVILNLDTLFPYNIGSLKVMLGGL